MTYYIESLDKKDGSYDHSEVMAAHKKGAKVESFVFDFNAWAPCSPTFQANFKYRAVMKDDSPAPQESVNHVELNPHYRYNCALPTQPSPAESLVTDPEAKVNVTLDGVLETLFRIGEYLGIDYAAARRTDGTPSDVYITAIESVRNAALDEALSICWSKTTVNETQLNIAIAGIESLKSQPAQPSDTDMLNWLIKNDAGVHKHTTNLCSGEPWIVKSRFETFAYSHISGREAIKAAMQAREGS